MKFASVGPNASVMVLEWRPWLYQLISAVISGGAGAVTTAFAAPLMDASKYNPLHVAYYEFIGLTFIGTAFLKMFFYLDTHPLPPEVQTVTTVQTVTQQEHPPATITKTVETTENASKKEKE